MDWSRAFNRCLSSRQFRCVSLVSVCVFVICSARTRSRKMEQEATYTFTYTSITWRSSRFVDSRPVFPDGKSCIRKKPRCSKIRPLNYGLDCSFLQSEFGIRTLCCTADHKMLGRCKSVTHQPPTKLRRCTLKGARTHSIVQRLRDSIKIRILSLAGDGTEDI